MFHHWPKRIASNRNEEGEGGETTGSFYPAVPFLIVKERRKDATVQVG